MSLEEYEFGMQQIQIQCCPVCGRNMSCHSELHLPCSNEELQDTEEPLEDSSSSK
jgi:hypothetical protein